MSSSVYDSMYTFQVQGDLWSLSLEVFSLGLPAISMPSYLDITHSSTSTTFCEVGGKVGVKYLEALLWDCYRTIIA